MMQRLINSFMFAPPSNTEAALKEIKPFTRTVYRDNRPISYLERIFLIKGQDESDDAMRKFVNVFYCHGNKMDIVSCDSRFRTFVNFFQAEMDMCENCFFDIELRLVLWEYPTYSVSRQQDLDINEMCKDAAELWDHIAVESDDVLNVCIGASIGSAFASYLSEDPLVDILILQAPFASLPSSVWNVEFLTGTIFDNMAHLEKANRHVHIHVFMSESDNIMKFESCSQILSIVDSYTIMGKGGDYPHSHFFKPSSFGLLGKTTFSLIQKSATFRCWLEIFEDIPPSRPGSTQDNIDQSTPEPKIESP